MVYPALVMFEASNLSVGRVTSTPFQLIGAPWFRSAQVLALLCEEVVDADDLETWLGLAPAVHSWLSALLGKSWGSVQDLRSYWSDWREATDPPLSAEIVLAGRSKEKEDLRKRIDEASVRVRVQGESADEAIAFIAATMQGMDQADALFTRVLVVNDNAGWGWAANSTTPLVLIPRFADLNTAQAIRRGHRVVIPVGREEGSSDDLVLPRLRRDAVKSALLSIGVAEEVAEDLAARGRASLTSLRRSLAIDKGLERPAWAHRVEAPALLPALLAGAWDETKPGDQEVIAGLADSFAMFDQVVRYALRKQLLKVFELECINSVAQR